MNQNLLKNSYWKVSQWLDKTKTRCIFTTNTLVHYGQINPATRICHLFHDCYWLVMCYHTIGVLKEQASPRRALQQYIDALDILDEQMNPPRCLQSSLLLNIGRIYYHRQDYPLAG